MVWMGAESGSQRVLEAMDKQQRVEDIRLAARWLKAAGVAVGFFLQFGYPGEQWADIESTLALVRDERPDDIGVSVSYPLPGTKFHARVREDLGLKQNWVDSADLAMMYRGTYSPDFYRQLHRLVHAEFRARQAATRLATAVRRPWLLRAEHVHHVATLGIEGAVRFLTRRRLARQARLAAADRSAAALVDGVAPARHAREVS